MCGIAGVCRRCEANPLDVDQVNRMISSLAHRGPDEKGIYLDDWAGLGHARLSIIDLGGGTQPIPNEDRTLWIVFNGEIFNYLELRKDLLQRHHRFTTVSDTEVILHLYEEKGAACLHELNGQFAFAIWNTRKHELFLARDRCGIRPIHYTEANGVFCFASEIKALFTQEGVTPKMDPIALDQIFTFWTTLGSRTAFAGISELPPGHFLRLSPDAMEIQRYWQVPMVDKSQWFEDRPEDLVAQAADLLEDAVRLRLRADVPVGSYLSGGLDSSGIAAMVSKRFNNSLKTFGIRFEQAEFDEGQFQRQMVDYLGCDHREITVGNTEVGSLFSQIIWHCEKPLLRTSPVPLYQLSQKVREEGLKVVLTGEGADEVFGGYNIFREAKVRRFWSRNPESTMRPALLARLYPYIFTEPRLKSSMLSFFSQGLEDVDNPLFSHVIRWGNTQKLKRFFSEDLRDVIGDYNGFEELRASLPSHFDRMDGLAKAQYLEMNLFLSNYLLSSQGDRMAMANSVEIRLPFLDYRLIEFMSRVPSRWKILGLHEKHLLKQVFKDFLPAAIVARSKHPYRAPIRQSLLNNVEKETFALLGEHAKEQTDLFDHRKVDLLLRKLNNASGPSEMDSMALAGIASTQHLIQQFMHQGTQDYVSLTEPDKLIDRRSCVQASVV